MVQKMKITAEFPGGNIRFLSRDGNVFHVEQDLKGTAKWWFYWCFRVEDPEEGTFRFQFHNGEVVSDHGPAISTDGIHWTWYKAGYVDHTCFTYTFGKNEKIRYFSFCFPYTLADFERFYAGISVQRDVLCKSEDGRDIPFLTFGHGERNVYLTARHHCCEAPASFVLEGLITAALETPALLERYRFHVFPFADLDGVEKGEQGKDRGPHDHNRDYMDEPLYAFVRAIQAYVKTAKPAVFLDLHAPLQWGSEDSKPHIHLSAPPEEGRDVQAEFLDKLVEYTTDEEVRFYGLGVVYKSNVVIYTSKRYFTRVCHADLSVTVETPYSGNKEEGYSMEGLRIWGRTIARALLEVSP